ncbi:hypothetical protein ACFC1I_15145 [Microbacterium sp. NPDC056044]|uniref:hypothetical protein n=1 Tax=Microbacterium sp. NPDC056044 TaxID=3345690 RepID=UPI0035DF0845
MSVRESIRLALVWALFAAYLIVALTDVVVKGQVFVLLGWTGFPLVGAMILTRSRGNAIGRLMLTIGLLWATAAGCLLAVGVWAAWLTLPAQFVVSIIGNLAALFAFGAVMLLVLIFPTGRIETKAGRLILASIAAVVAYAIAGYAFVPAPPPSELSTPWALVGVGATTGPDGILLNLAVPVLLAVELVELSFRWHRSSENERYQFRWFAFGCATVIALMVAVLPIQAVLPQDFETMDKYARVLILLMNAIPLAIGVAVLRYGLYEIGRVVSRAVTYTIVTALSVGVYALVVTSVTWLLPAAPAFAVAAATLAAAALFLPVLRRVQASVDRRFDRERYDAERVVDAFGERVRTGADPSTTGDALLAAASQTLQPAATGLWVSGSLR